MYTKKLNLVMNLPGRVMLSEEDCLKKVRRPMTDKYGNKILDKQGNPKYKTVVEYDYSKTDKTVITFHDRRKDENVTVNVYTRKCKPAQRSISVSQECYNSYISSKEVPLKYKGTKHQWANLSETQRLEWNLIELCEALGGTLDSYHILK